MPLALGPEPWFADAQDLMLEERLGLSQACAYLGIPGVDEAFAAAVMRRRAWRELWATKSKAFVEAKASPLVNTKAALLGTMISDAERLREMGKFKEAADVLKEVAKISGFSSPDQVINVFQETTGADLESALAKLRATPRPN